MLCVCMRGLYSMQREAIYKVPQLDPRIGIYTSCTYRQEWVGLSPCEKSLYYTKHTYIDVQQTYITFIISWCLLLYKRTPT